MTLLEECMIALGDSAKILDLQETKNIFNTMVNIFPMTSWGRIDWENVIEKSEVVPQKDILMQLSRVKNIDTEVYVLWDEASLPIVKTNLQNVIDAVDDVTAVSFDTWIFCPSDSYVIEFYHENQVRVGWKNS